MRVLMNRTVRLGALGATALACALAAASARAQAGAPSDAHGLYKACIGDPLNGHDTIQTVDQTIYTCGGSVAQNFFEYLVSTNAAQTVDKQRTGTYIFRAIPQPQSGRCWNKLENADGIQTSTFGCSISVVKLAK
jgi:hypothetical protein